MKFSAACLLECTEFLTGVPDSFCSTSGDGSDGLLPAVRNSLPHVPTRDITFVQLDGDFKVCCTDCTTVLWLRCNSCSLGCEAAKLWHLLSCAQAFRGIWRMQPGNPGSTILYYSLYVQPQAWLPVKLIQNRIEREVVKNLAAVAVYSEQQHQLNGARTA